MKDPFAREPVPLRLGAVAWPEADALLSGLARPVQRDSPESLITALEQGTVDVALLPPLVAWQMENVRFVPGLALTRASAEVGGTDATPWHDTALAAVLGLPAGARLGDLVAAWGSPAPRPLVLLVWACRARAPHAEIRRTLMHAQRMGEGSIPLAPGLTLRLGSDESDALHDLLRRAKANELLPQGQQLVYC